MTSDHAKWETGELIIYTSADPVLQIAAHEDIILWMNSTVSVNDARSITLERPALLGRIIAAPLCWRARKLHTYG